MRSPLFPLRFILLFVLWAYECAWVYVCTPYACSYRRHEIALLLEIQIVVGCYMTTGLLTMIFYKKSKCLKACPMSLDLPSHLSIPYVSERPSPWSSQTINSTDFIFTFLVQVLLHHIDKCISSMISFSANNFYCLLLQNKSSQNFQLF